MWHVTVQRSALFLEVQVSKSITIHDVVELSDGFISKTPFDCSKLPTIFWHIYDSVFVVTLFFILFFPNLAPFFDAFRVCHKDFPRDVRVRCAAILHRLCVSVPAASIGLGRVMPELLLLHLEADGG